MNELIYTLTFAGLALLTCGSAILVCFLRNILHSAVALFFALLGIAGLYVMVGADFLAGIHLLIYAGGILVLIIFGVFLTTRAYGVNVQWSSQTLSKGWGILISLGVFFLLVLGIHLTPWPEGTPEHEPTVSRLGDLLLTKFLLPFEVISILLLFAMVGAVILVRKEMKGDGQ